MIDTSLLENIIVGRVEPHIYAFTTNTIPDYLKVGDTYRPVSVRLNEWKRYFPELTKQYEDKAKVADDVYFRDYAVHRFLESEKIRERLQQQDIDEGTYYSNEFFKDASADDVREAITDIASDYEKRTDKYQFYNAESRLAETFIFERTETYDPRPNQDKTIQAFKAAVDGGRTNLLMYAVMRFGKSFTSMCCAVEMNANFVVIVSAKADVLLEWKKTVESHVKFSDYDFVTSDDLLHDNSVIPDKLNSGRKVAAFLTLQDLQGNTIKDKHQQVFGRQTDLLIIDETHFGARAAKYGAVLREKDVKEKGDKEESFTLDDVGEEVKTFDVHIKLHLSGTPYRILMGSEFSKEDIIAFYQFTDIVEDQEKWDAEHILSDEVREWDNPYYGFPQMVRFAFHPNESSRRRMEELRKNGSTYAFSALFKPKSIKRADDGSHKKFIYEQEILELLEVIDGSKEDSELLGFLDYDKIKEGKMCRHIVCVLPYCASCDALEALIRDNTDKFRNLNDYEIINISGVDRPREYKTPGEIKTRIRECEAAGKKTVTFTVNRMLTGSTVEQWDTMLFLKDTASPQDYDQAIFRLQNQYIKTYVNGDDKKIKYNMKPQTLLVDFDPNRVFLMQEQKAQIYNVNVDEAGNSKLSDRIKEELRISPVIVLNRDKMEQIQAADILKAVSEYSRSRGVAEETQEIPVDMSLMGFDAIREAIERENELGSKAGLTINNAEGNGQEMNTPTGEESGLAAEILIPEVPETPAADEQTDDTKDQAKQFRSYYARILFFAFLTRNVIISLNDIISCIDEVDNMRIAHNLGIRKETLECIQTHADKFMLRALDYKIQNLNQLSHDDSLEGIERAAVAVQKFGKLGESEVITPRSICNDMVNLIPEEGLKAVLENGRKILDIAGKAGEFAIALCDRYAKMGYSTETLRNTIYTIPTSGLTYEFTRMVYDILNLNTDCIAAKFTSYSMLNVKDEDTQEIDYKKTRLLLSQDKPFNEIEMSDIVTEGDEKVKFDVVVGNPPYQLNDGGYGASAIPIYQKFVEQALAISQNYSSMIIPSRWMTGGRGLNSFRNHMLNSNNFIHLNDYSDSGECFSGVEIKGGICFFLIDTTYNGKCKIVRHDKAEIRESNRYLLEPGDNIFIRDDRLISVKNKVYTSSNTSFESLVSPMRPYGLRGDIFKDPGKYGLPKMYKTFRTDYYKILGLEDLRRTYRFIPKEYPLPNSNGLLNDYKIFVTRNWGIGSFDDIPSSPVIAKPGEICTETFLEIGPFVSNEEAENAYSYIKTRLFRALVAIRKQDQGASRAVYHYVPIQDFSRPWTDADLYAKYGLTDDEIAFIESTIKPME